MTNKKFADFIEASLVEIICFVVGASVGVLVVVGFYSGYEFLYDSREGDAAVAHATWAVAFFTFVLAIGIPLTIWDSAKKALEQEQDQFYAQLDGMYLKIQSLVIEHPHLSNPALLWKEAKRDQLAQYDAFAFVVWNFIESIHDFTKREDRFWQSRRKTEMLSDTWECIIKYESARHKEWFVRPDNENKFKKSFREYVERELGIGTTTPPQASVT